MKYFPFGWACCALKETFFFWISFAALSILLVSHKVPPNRKQLEPSQNPRATGDNPLEEQSLRN